MRNSSNSLPETFTGPGLFDIQINGFAGFDFNSPPDSWSVDALMRLRNALARRGILKALPTFITGDPEITIRRAAAYAEVLESEPELERAFPGLHIEGPFISPEDGPRGAHPKEYCTTPKELPDFLDRVNDACRGRLLILTLAPELPGAMKLIATASRMGILIAIGHTSASDEIVHGAVESGARLSTHLGNGAHNTLPKSRNYIQTQLAEDELFASFIADGHHLPFGTLKNFIRAKTHERSILVSDAISAAGMGPGVYSLGGEEVRVTEDLRASKPGQSNLSGSALPLDRAVVNVALHCGVPFETAWRMASAVPAELLGIALPAETTVRVGYEGLERVN